MSKARALFAAAVSAAITFGFGGAGAAVGESRLHPYPVWAERLPHAINQTHTLIQDERASNSEGGRLRVVLNSAASPTRAFDNTAHRQVILAASPPKTGCLSGFVYRDAKNGDGVCVTPEERAAAKQQNANSKQHTKSSGNCRTGFVWRDAWDGDAVCVTPAERSAAKAQNAMDARRSRYAGVAVPVTPAPPPSQTSQKVSVCKSGFVWRDAKDGDGVCVTPQERAAAKRQNANAPNNTLPTGNCKPGFVWRDAWNGDGVCVTPNERAAAKRQNARNEERSTGETPSPAAEPKPQPAKHTDDQPDTDQDADAGAQQKGNCKGSFVWRDPENNDFICVTRTERALAKQQNIEAARHTTESGRCHSGYVWRDAWDGDVICVTKSERTLAKAQNALHALRSKGDGDAEATHTNKHCKNGFVTRNAGKGDVVCVTREERKLAKLQNENGPNNAKSSGECRSGYVWRDAWDGDGVCVTPQERAEAKAQNARGSQNTAD